MGSAVSSLNVYDNVVDALKAVRCLNGPESASLLQARSGHHDMPPIILFGDKHDARPHEECKHLDTVLRAVLPACNVEDSKHIAMFFERAPRRKLTTLPFRELHNIYRYSISFTRAKKNCMTLHDRPDNKKLYKFYSADLASELRRDCLTQIQSNETTGFKQSCRRCVVKLAAIGKQQPLAPVPIEKAEHDHLKAVSQQFVKLCETWPLPYIEFARRRELEIALEAMALHDSEYSRIRGRDRSYYNRLYDMLNVYTDCIAVRTMMKVAPDCSIVMAYWGSHHEEQQTELLLKLGYQLVEKLDLRFKSR